MESHFDASEDDPRPTNAAYVTGQLQIVKAARQIALYAYEACTEERSNVTKLEVSDV